MANGKIYFITPQTVLALESTGSTGWVDLNLAGNIPDGSVGALLNLCVFRSSQLATLHVRKKGYEGDITQRVETVSDNTWIHNFVIVECDAARVIQYEVTGQGEAEDAHCYIWLVGYVF